MKRSHSPDNQGRLYQLAGPRFQGCACHSRSSPRANHDPQRRLLHFPQVNCKHTGSLDRHNTVYVLVWSSRCPKSPVLIIPFNAEIPPQTALRQWKGPAMKRWRKALMWWQAGASIGRQISPSINFACDNVSYLTILQPCTHFIHSLCPDTVRLRNRQRPRCSRGNWSTHRKTPFRLNGPRPRLGPASRCR